MAAAMATAGRRHHLGTASGTAEDPPPSGRELALADRGLHEAVRQLGDDRGQQQREDELGHGQLVARHAADHLIDRPVIEVQPVRARADPPEHRVPEEPIGVRAPMGDRSDDRQRRQPREEDPATEHEGIGTARSHQIGVPAEPSEADDPDQRHERRRAGPWNAVGPERSRADARPSRTPRRGESR